MATTPGFSWRKWSAKQSILAALLGALVVIAMIAGISISLAPAHIYFAIASAALTNSTEKTGNQNLTHWYYNFTLVANNTSGRTSTSFRHLTAKIWFGPTSWIPIVINTTAELPGWQLPGNTTKISVGTKLGRYSQSNTTREEGSPGCPTNDLTTFGQDDQQASYNASKAGAVARWPNSTVVVEAKVRFRFGRTITMLYTVRASCNPVYFLNNGRGTHSLVECIP